MTDLTFPLAITWTLTDKSDEPKFIDELIAFSTVQMNSGRLAIDFIDYDTRAAHGTVISEKIRDEIKLAFKDIAMSNFVYLQTDPK